MEESGSDRSAPLTRRASLYQLGVWAIGGVFSLLLAVPLVGMFVSSLLHREPEQWVRVCALSEIAEDEPRLFKVAFRRESAHRPYDEERGVFVIRKGSEILAFSSVCTHMSCSVRWLAWRQQILCPCHGGVFDRWGYWVGGPPPASLPFFESRIDGDALYVSSQLRARG